MRKAPTYAFALFLLAPAYSYASRHADAIEMGERLVSVSQEASFFKTIFKTILANVYCRAGMRGKARAIVDELSERRRSEYVSPLTLAWGFGALGDTEAALDHLAQAVDEHSPYLFAIHQDPFWDPLRSQPRFTELASQVGSGVVKSYSPAD